MGGSDPARACPVQERAQEGHGRISPSKKLRPREGRRLFPGPGLSSPRSLGPAPLRDPCGPPSAVSPGWNQGGRREGCCASVRSPVFPVPPTFRQAPGGPQDAILVRAGDRAVLSCETDSLPEPTVTWLKDGQPLVPTQRTRALLGGQRLEVQDTQVSGPEAWAAVGGRGARAW